MTKKSYHCSLCEARETGKHPWECGVWEPDELPAILLRADPDYPDVRKPVYWYEEQARSMGWKPKGLK